MKELKRKWIYLISILLILFIPYIISADVHGKVEFGYVSEIEGFESIIEIEYRPLDFISIYGGINTLMIYGGDLRFRPYQDIYSIGLQLIYKQLYFDMRHSCTHQVISGTERSHDKRQTGNKTKYSIGIIW